MPEDGPKKRARKRALILAGGGMKVAFQAGVLQVWLDEAGRRFDHVDGASGGVFNLAMLCQGMSGTEIANNWRRYRPMRVIQPNWGELLKGPYARSLFRLDRFRTNAFRQWGVDERAIRASKLEATFNVYNFSRHTLEVIEPADMTEDMLVAAVSLPMFFPPVVIDGDTYIDAVYVTDANIEEALRRGADELWIIWTVSRSGRWRDGFLAHYFQIIEASALGDLERMCERIKISNQRFAASQPSEFGRHIEVRSLEYDVPVHYLINFNADRIRTAVELGVAKAREWCKKEGVPFEPGAPEPVHDPTWLRFTETMHGHIRFGTDNCHRAGPDDEPLRFRLTIRIDGTDRFITHPDHEAIATGTVICDALGGRLPVEKGWFNLLQYASGPGDQRMRYRLFFRDAARHRLTLSGHKVVANDPGPDLWPDTTTLFVRILQGHVGPEEENAAVVVASGVLQLTPLDFGRQLTTIRVGAPTRSERRRILFRFGRLFLGRLMDVYGKWLMHLAPV